MLELLFDQYKSYSNEHIFLEIIAVLFGIASVLLAKKNHIWVYPSGIISTTIFVYLLFQWELFGDMIVNIYYSIMSIYGWYLWSLKKNETDEFPISKANKDDYIKAMLLFCFTLIFVVLVYNYFSKFTSWTAYVDTLTTVMFFAGMWLMAKRKIENWMVWIVANIISVPLYLFKGYTFTSLQYVIFTILAYLAYKEWKKNLVN